MNVMSLLFALSLAAMSANHDEAVAYMQKVGKMEPKIGAALQSYSGAFGLECGHRPDVETLKTFHGGAFFGVIAKAQSEGALGIMRVTKVLKESRYEFPCEDEQ